MLYKNKYIYKHINLKKKKKKKDFLNCNLNKFCIFNIIKI